MSTLGEIQPNQITISTIHMNTELTLIQITEDKLRIVLMEHLSKPESKRAWQVPFGIFLTIISLFLTSDFKDFATIDKATWRAFFMFMALVSAGWFLVSLRDAFSSISLDGLVEKIKNVAHKKT